MKVKFAISKTNQPLILLEEDDIFSRMSFTENSISLEDYLVHKDNLKEAVESKKIIITEILVHEVHVYFTDLDSFENYNNTFQKPQPIEAITKFINDIRT